MPAKAKVYCRSCDVQHERPVGRNCVRKAQVGEVAATAGSTSGPSHTSTSNPPDSATDLILSRLSDIQGQFTSMDERVRKMEAAVAGRTTDRAMSQESLTQTPASSVATNLDPVQNDNVVPTTDFLSTNAIIQRQVDARLLEYGSMAA